ncbi:Signal peptidase I T [compost metagenome]
MDKQEKAALVKKNWLREFLGWVWIIPVAFFANMLIQNYAFAQTEVRSISMQGTLYEGQRLIEDKLSYRFSDPGRGDIVILDGPEYKERLIKRLIGLPGDIIDIKDGHLYVNGQLQEEPYVKGQTNAAGLAVPYTVPEGHVFVMGDNRERSTDSRQLGPIAFASIEGKAVLRVWPLQDFGQMD